MKLSLLLLTLTLGGCANVNGVLTPIHLAKFYDWRDDCQLQNVRGATEDEKIRNMPSYCGASGPRATIRNANGYVIGTIGAPR